MTSIQDIFTLGREFNSQGIRLCEIDGVKYASVLDVITAVTDNPNTSRVVWHRLKNDRDRADLTSGCSTFTFPGNRGGPTPIADASTMLSIIFVLSGPKANDFRAGAASALLNVLAPDQDFIDSLQERHDNQAEGITDGDVDGDTTSFLDTRDQRIVRIASRCYNDTYMYVRIRLPDEYIRDIETTKQLSMSVIKFGIAYVIQDRHNTYPEDNGFMAFSYTMNSRKEAKIIEDVLKLEFETITAYNSREYVDTTRLSEMLGFVGFSEDSYESYVELSRRLFARMVRLIKALWPRYSDTHGFMYSIKESIPRSVQTTISVSGSLDRPSEVEVSFPRTIISPNMAKEMDLIDDVAKLRQQIEDLQAPPPPITTTTTSLPPDTEENTSRSKGAVYSHDLVTGEEKRYESAERAALDCGMSGASFRRTVLGKMRQVGGRSWRKEGMPVWVPPEGFCFDDNFDPLSTSGFILAVHQEDDSIRKVFESITAAARIMGLERRKLSDMVASGRVFAGYAWSELPQQAWGTWVDDPSSAAPIPNAAVDSAVNGRCNGRIIARVLATGQDTVYESLNKAAAVHKLSPHTLREQLLDKPRQAFGKCFRSFTATECWVPPENLVYDASTYVTKTSGYVKSINEATGEVRIYESVRAACSLMGANTKTWTIQQYMNTGKACHGLKWFSATEEDYVIMQPVHST
jgi:hypothetical protein